MYILQLRSQNFFLKDLFMEVETNIFLINKTASTDNTIYYYDPILDFNIETGKC